MLQEYIVREYYDDDPQHETKTIMTWEEIISVYPYLSEIPAPYETDVISVHIIVDLYELEIKPK